MSSNPTTSRGASILWAQVCGLALVQGAIALTWVIYNLYLVQLLESFGFPKALATGLLIIENLLAMVMEPLMGSFSDRLQHQVGTRFPLISLGMVLSAGCFLAIPMVLLGGQATLFRWVLPLMLVAWALAMTVFRSPAMSLLGRYAFRTQLPLAAGILTLVGGLAGAMGPLASQFILGLGPMAAFGIGSGVLIIAALTLTVIGPNRDVAGSSPATGGILALPWGRLLWVFGTGVGVTLGFRLIMGTFPMVLKGQVPNSNPATVMGTIFVTLALTAIPSGALAVRLGNRRAMMIGLGGMALVCAAVIAIHSTAMGMVLAALFGASFSLVSNGTIPFALSMVPTEKAGLGTGIYFSGGALASSLFGALFGGSLALTPALGAGLGSGAFLLAALCVGLSTGRSR
ncbi:MAG: SLC45 family MFS transporter [Leptolyngbya sp. RL_3_1]|nr:SLC45 family MFS transporter [Leptolyngbya sp. RL_3_1]